MLSLWEFLSCTLVMVYLSVSTSKLVECCKPAFTEEKKGKPEGKRKRREGKKEGKGERKEGKRRND